jgi:hypothetical protein
LNIKLAIKTNESGAFNAAVSWFMKEEFVILV